MRWTASLDHVVANALVGQGLCDVVLVDSATPGAVELVRQGLNHALVVWIGDHAPGDVWLQMDPSSSASSVTSALLSAVRHAHVRHPPARISTDIIGRSYAIRHIHRAIGPVAQSAECALITGPTGAGKQDLARELHSRSDRSGALVHVYCDGDSVSEQLFGEDGVLVQRPATDDTIVLHDVDRLPEPVQRTLCTWLRGHHSAVRVLSLSSKNPSDSLHQDLYFRLATIHLRLPALAERPEDIDPLVQHILEQLKAAPATPEALTVLREWSWPGNLAELRSVLAQACVESEGASIATHHLARRIRSNQVVGPSLSVSHDRTLATMEEQTITRALVRQQGNVTEVGRELGISRSTLYRKLRKYGLR